MSQDVASGIFKAILGFYERYLDDEKYKVVVSKSAIDGAHIYHYHRPHLETELKPNSLVTVHHDLRDSDRWLSFEKFQPRYEQAKCIVCINSNQESYLNDVGITNTYLVPHGVTDNFVTAARKRTIKPHGSKINLAVISKRYGRKVKGEAHLYELAKSLDNTKFRFTLVGGNRGSDYRYLTSLGFEVKLYEYFPYVMFPNLYNEVDILLMLSYFEGGPANIPEAVASGTPVFGRNVGLVSDYTTHQENGWYSTGDPREDAMFLNALSPSDLLEVQENAERLKPTVLTWKSVVDRYSAIYDEIVHEVVQSSKEQCDVK